MAVEEEAEIYQVGRTDAAPAQPSTWLRTTGSTLALQASLSVTPQVTH